MKIIGRQLYEHKKHGCVFIYDSDGNQIIKGCARYCWKQGWNLLFQINTNTYSCDLQPDPDANLFRRAIGSCKYTGTMLRQNEKYATLTVRNSVVDPVLELHDRTDTVCVGRSSLPDEYNAFIISINGSPIFSIDCGPACEERPPSFLEFIGVKPSLLGVFNQDIRMNPNDSDYLFLCALFVTSTMLSRFRRTVVGP